MNFTIEIEQDVKLRSHPALARTSSGRASNVYCLKLNSN